MWAFDVGGKTIINLAHAELISVVELEPNEDEVNLEAPTRFALAATLTSSDELQYLFIGNEIECLVKLEKLITRVPFLKGL